MTQRKMAQTKRKLATENVKPPSPAFTTDVGELTKLCAARNQSFIKFFYHRMHQYESFYKKMIDDYAAQIEAYNQLSAHDYKHPDAEAPLDYASNLLQAQEDAAEIIEQAKAQAERILNGAYERSEAIKAAAAQNNGASTRRKSAQG